MRAFSYCKWRNMFHQVSDIFIWTVQSSFSAGNWIKICGMEICENHEHNTGVRMTFGVKNIIIDYWILVCWQSCLYLPLSNLSRNIILSPKGQENVRKVKILYCYFGKRGRVYIIMQTDDMKFCIILLCAKISNLQAFTKSTWLKASEAGLCGHIPWTNYGPILVSLAGLEI